MRARTLAWAAALLAVLGGCARQVAPPGGPVDATPAIIADAWPPDGSLDNGRLDTVILTFSERVDRGSVIASLRTDPPRLLRSVRWEADTLAALRFWQPFPSDTTVAVFLAPGWKDRRRVEQPGWEAVHFATGDSLLPGWLAGTVTFKGNPSRSMHLELVDLVAAAPAGAAALRTGDLRRVLRPDRKGGFVIRHLPADGRALRLVAWQDVDGDSLYDAAVDFADSLGDTNLVLTPAAPRRLALAIDVIDPDEPGEIRGNVACLDTLPGLLVLRFFPDSLRLAGDSLPGRDPADLPDSLRRRLADRRAQWRLILPAGGDFSLDGAPPGPWWLHVFKETGADTVWDPAAEPAYLEPGPRWLPPGGVLGLGRIAFPAPSAAPADSAVGGAGPAGGGGP
ncbi:MAG: hypothetical protein JW819_11115 [Candidatus Krumholzibacteriota bacterium]|nr:hypothetical protein [Candidatus Krumholzibacteriota bacterium]